MVRTERRDPSQARFRVVEGWTLDKYSSGKTKTNNNKQQYESTQVWEKSTAQDGHGQTGTVHRPIGR